MAGRTLDVPFRQCLVQYPNDQDGLIWHHRLLLARGPDMQWIWATPTLSVQRGDLSKTQVFPLRRAAPFPRDLAAETFAFDPLNGEELEALIAEAFELAEIYGFDTSGLKSEASTGGIWRVCDSRSAHFGGELPAAAVLDPNVMIQRGTVGLVLVDGSWLHAVRVDGADAAREPVMPGGPVAITSWSQYKQLSLGGKERDPRLLGDDRDQRGARHLVFSLTFQRSDAVDLVGYPLRGPRVGPELMIALRDVGQDGFDHHHIVWASRSGAAERSAAVRDHRMWSTLLRIGVSFDLLDPANCACLEFAARRLAQIETAVKRNPKSPDYEGLDAMLEATIDSSGAALVPVFSGWFGDLRNSQAVVLKADRQFREEQVAQAKSKGHKGRDGKADE